MIRDHYLLYDDERRMTIDTLVLATRNIHKTAELRQLLEGTGIAVRDLTEFPDCPEVEEDGTTLEENALKKARSAYRCTGLPVIADDSGLEVNYLLGRPGVYSARFAGEGASYADNNRKLIRDLAGVPARRRGARFRCVIAFVTGSQEQLFNGRVEGHILPAARGENGFGYDPLFRPIGHDESYAELTNREKNRISHRTHAMQQFVSSLKNT